jgi:phosphopantothenoylcysteine decarboxylase
MSDQRTLSKAPDDEWQGWNRMGDPVLHVELRDWADIVVIAPLSAHTLAKLASGLCDDTLTCVLRAWDFGHHVERPAKYVVLAPAMNTAMWQHPLTQEQLQKIKSFSESDVVRIVPPMVKTLACGEVGQGALAEVTKIVTEVQAVFLATAPRM